MRLLLALLLAFAIPFNAVYAAAAGICDGLEGYPQHGQHVGHHVHAHDHDAPANGDLQPSGSDHNHSHAHPLLSWMMPAEIGVHSLPAASVALPLTDTSFVSAIPPRLERPPRHVHVA